LLFLIPFAAYAQDPLPTLSVEKGSGKLFQQKYLNFYMHNEGGDFLGCDIRVRAALKESALLKDPFNINRDIFFEASQSGAFFADEPDRYFGLLPGKKVPKVIAYFMLLIQCEDQLYTSEAFELDLTAGKKMSKAKKKKQKKKFRNAIKKWRKNNIERFGDLV